MGRLLELARATERTLFSRFGKWMLEVSKSIDTLLGAGALGFAGGQYLEVAQVGANGLVQVNVDVVPNTVIAQQGIAYNTGTGVATLTAGRTYRLVAAGSLVSFIGGAPPFFDITWVDATTNTPLDARVVGTWIPVSDTANAAPANQVELIYTAPSNQTVKLRSTSSGGGTAQTVASHFWAIIQQIA